ncbi:MAG: hypothetical protein LBK75_03690 [Oscillospiraceae bacterium]|jgi:hypothetical protein|nr:hypothetical protein [Oscillospiraceae bacterium]
MESVEILQKIDLLPVTQRMLIVEKIIHSIRKEEQKTILREAANALYNDYKNDQDLTYFTNLDCEGFYETK